MTRILIATGIYPPSIGGPATYSKILKDELPKHGLAADVLSFDSVRHLPKGVSHFFYFLKALQMGSKADIIFAQDPVSVGLPAALAAKILRKKFVLKIVGDYAWEQGQYNVSSIKYNKGGEFITPDQFQERKFDFATELRRKIERWVAKEADKIIVPSEYLKKIIRMWGVKEEKTKVIYNSVDGINSNSKDAGQAGGEYLLSVGRLVAWKGFEELIELLAELPQEIKLIIVGEGPEERSLKLKVESLKLVHRVEFAGRVPREKMNEYFSRAKLFVLSTGYEGLSHVILEAMQSGVPVITTNIGGNPELIKNGWNGILVEYGDKKQLKEAIANLWKDEESRRKFIVNSLAESKKFSREKMIGEIIRELKSA